MKNRLEIGFTSKLVPVKPVNEQFTLCKCYVMALGKNQNKSNISKESADDAMPSIFNIPVVGHLYVDEDNICRMGGHDLELIKDDNGKFKFRVLTVPFGVVPSDNNIRYEEVFENGELKTYLAADILLWTGRYPELLDAKYDDDIWFAQSMEIIPSQTSKEDGYLNIEKFQYSALCLLGKSDDPSKNVAPCFKSARVEPYEFSDTEAWSKLYEEFKFELAKCYSKESFGEGGDGTLDNEVQVQAEIFEENPVDGEPIAEPAEVEEVKTEGENPSEEPVAENVQTEEFNAEEPQQDSKPVEPVADNAEPAVEPSAESKEFTEEQPVKFSVELTAEEKMKALSEKLMELDVWSEDYYAYHVLVDHDSQYAYVWYHYAGVSVGDETGYARFGYAINDNEISIDADSFTKVRRVWMSAEDEEKLSQHNALFEELKAYKEKRIEEDRQKEFAGIISEFSDLGEVEEYKELVKNAMNFESAEALSEKLYAIRGKNMKKPAKKPLDQIRIPVGFTGESKEVSDVDQFMNKYLHHKK